MSYSFSKRADTKAAALDAVKSYFDEEVCKHQPQHKLDIPIVLTAAASLVTKMREIADGEQLEIALSGHVQAVSGAAEIEHVEVNALAVRFVKKSPVPVVEK